MRFNRIMRWLAPVVTPFYIIDDDGAGEISGTDVVGTGNDQRLALLDQINDRNDAERAEEFRLVNDDDTTEPFTVEGEPVLVEPEQEPEPEQTPEPVAAVPKIRVNGEDVELTPDLIAKAQKIASGDKYLEDAALAKKAASQPQPVQPPSQEDVDRSSGEEELALVRAIQMGTEEEAVAALRKIRTQPTGMTADDVGRIADERLAFNTALDWFNDEYKDLVEDPQLHGIVVQRELALVKSGDKRPYKERYKSVGDEVRQWRDSLVKRFTPKPEPNPIEVKEERKANAPRTPVPVNARSRPPVDDEPDDTPSSVIANMAKARGGLQAMR